MQQYIGTKLINSLAMTRLEWCTFRGWDLPKDENGSDEGYMVEYLDGGKANTTEYPNYVSWSPKDVFERAYRPCNAMTFGLAIEALKTGKRVARAGWNGKGMFISIQCGSTITKDQARGGVAKCLADDGAESITILPHVDMKAADGNVVVGWLASQTDMLAEDWVIVE